MRRMATSVAAAAVGLALTAGRAASQGQTNGWYTVHASETGEYTAETGPLQGSPTRNVFYDGIVARPGTTWNSIRSYDSGRELVLRRTAETASGGFTCDTLTAAAGTPLIEGILGPSREFTGYRWTWHLDDPPDDLWIVQEVQAVGETLQGSAVRVTLCIRNLSTARTASVGARFLWDWSLDGVDAPYLGPQPPDPPSEPLLSREQLWADPAFDGFDVAQVERPSVTPSNYVLTATVAQPVGALTPTPPDLLQYVDWFAAKDTCFDYGLTGATIAGPFGSGRDSAVTYSWGHAAGSAIRILPNETWCATQYVFVDVVVVDPPCSVDAQAFGGINCGGATATIDASSSLSTNCASALEYLFRDPTGLIAGDWSSSPFFDADASGSWTVEARCAVEPDCAEAEAIEVILDQPPRPGPGSAQDLLPCNAAIEVRWDPATWADAAGGTYHVHRSTVSCGDALAQPPLAAGLTTTGFLDGTTSQGGTYHYAVVAESATPARACAPGPNGGATATTCIGPVTERADATPPPHLCWPLRVSHRGDTVKLDWSLGRALLEGEHAHVRKARDDASAAFDLVSAEGFVESSWSETDASSPLQFFDVRYANACEIESPDDEPPGRDPPPVPCP